ncbi:antitoxin HicB [Planctomycetales bacterium]|nr:antitoxin HicB [Planctomycetales bacterium]
MQNNKFVDKYTYRVEWSEEDQTHIARCLEFPSLAAHGNTTDRALKEIEKVVTETVNWLQEEREPVPEPFGLKQYTGHLTLRVPTEIHKQLVIQSSEEGISVNQYILTKIEN